MMSFRTATSLQLVERIVFVGFGLIATNILVSEGFQGLFKAAISIVRKLPGIDAIINVVLDSEVKGAVNLLAGSKSTASQTLSNAVIPVPEEGISAIEVLNIVKSLHERENAAEEGKAFAYTYTTATEMKQLSQVLAESYAIFTETPEDVSGDHKILLERVWERFMHTNALNPMMYPSLRKFETEIISMTAWMTNGDKNTVGSVTSGGTESILMAIKAYRDRARKLAPHVSRPNMVVPTTIHPAFEKAGHYFGVDVIHVPLRSDFRVDVNAVAKAVNSQTILIVGSASQYCHGVIDPIEKLAELAVSRGLPLHVDACFGGFMLPWLERLGQPIPLWDFRVPGVTSISADVHKYGYSSKGASVILYKDAELRSFQYFSFSTWPGGLFGSPSMAGSRPGGMLASAWAAMVSMGQNGYLKLAAQILQSTKQLLEGVGKIDGIKIATPPDMTAVAIVSDHPRVNILAVADAMERIGGWKMERQQLPDSLHMSVLPQHARVIPQLLKDLEQAVKEVRENPALAKQGTTGVYGMVAAIPDKSIIDDFVTKFFSSIYTTDSGAGIIDAYRANLAAASAAASPEPKA